MFDEGQTTFFRHRGTMLYSTSPDALAGALQLISYFFTVAAALFGLVFTARA